LEKRVEDAEIGLRVGADGRGPAPAAVVGGEVAVEEGEGEMGFAEAPVDLEINLLEEKAAGWWWIGKG
jgi:hypothetical protein